jgi:hypothetical protein
MKQFNPSPIQRDLNNHFTYQLRQFLEDSMDTCLHGGVSRGAAGTMLLAMLIVEAAEATVLMNGPEEDFVYAAKLAYQQAALRLGKPKKRARKVVVT